MKTFHAMTSGYAVMLWQAFLKSNPDPSQVRAQLEAEAGSGNKVWIWLNDKVTVDGQVLDNYFDRKNAGIPIPARGPIELQTHNSEMRFRNIYIREIPPGKSCRSSPTASPTERRCSECIISPSMLYTSISTISLFSGRRTVNDPSSTGFG